MSSTPPSARIVKLWNNPRVGLTGLTRFQQKLQGLGIKVDVEDLKAMLAAQPSHHLFSENPRAKKWNTITETGVAHGMQMDLMDMKQIATRNKNFAWILCIIDVYSRYAWAFPVKRKTKLEIHRVLKAWLENLRSLRPRRLTSDAGTEFTSKSVERLLQHYGITQYVNQVGDKTTTGIVERFNRTLRDLIGRNFTRRGKLQWVEDLPMLVQNYNASRHSTLGTTPKDVWEGQALPKTRVISRENFPFHAGDVVRILLPRTLFDKKAGSEKWSTTVYSVVRREGFKYVIRNDRGEELKRRYRPSHLQRVSDAEKRAFSVSPPHPKASAVQQQVRKAKSQRRTKAVLKRHGLHASQLRESRLRPSTRRQRLRTSG